MPPNAYSTRMDFEEIVKCLVCRSCGNQSLVSGLTGVSCPHCLLNYKYVEGKVFVDERQGIDAKKLPKSLKDSTVDKNALRAESRSYLRNVLNTIKFESALDVGTGRGHYISELGSDKKVLTLDYLPYDDVLVVANIEKGLPICETSFDVIILSHTLEHIFDTKALISDCFRILKPRGSLVGVIPFLTKVHQAPFDFHRLTDFALERHFEEVGFINIEVSPLNSVVETISLHLNSSYKLLSKEMSVFQKAVLKSLIKTWETTLRSLQSGEKRPDFTLGYGFHCKKA